MSFTKVIPGIYISHNIRVAFTYFFMLGTYFVLVGTYFVIGHAVLLMAQLVGTAF